MRASLVAFALQPQPLQPVQPSADHPQTPSNPHNPPKPPSSRSPRTLRPLTRQHLPHEPTPTIPDHPFRRHLAHPACTPAFRTFLRAYRPTPCKLQAFGPLARCGARTCARVRVAHTVPVHMYTQRPPTRSPADLPCPHGTVLATRACAPQRVRARMSLAPCAYLPRKGPRRVCIACHKPSGGGGVRCKGERYAPG